MLVDMQCQCSVCNVAQRHVDNRKVEAPPGSAIEDELDVYKRIVQRMVDGGIDWDSGYYDGQKAVEEWLLSALYELQNGRIDHALDLLDTYDEAEWDWGDGPLRVNFDDDEWRERWEEEDRQRRKETG